MNRKLFLLSAVLVPFASSAAFATDWYVDGSHGHSCDARGTRSQPFKEYRCAERRANPGDTIHLLPTTTYEALFITVSGRAGAPVTITGDESGLTHVSNGTGRDEEGYAIDVNDARYVNVRNFDVTHRHKTGPQPSSGILVKSSRHVEISGNSVHDVGGNGIVSLEADYLTIFGNVVHDSGWNTKTGIFNSGISVLRSVNSDNDTHSHKIIISSNVVYHNYNLPRRPGEECTSRSSLRSCHEYYSDSDGNGIIMDRNADPGSGHAKYNGRTLITNNVVFGNGGRGIHLYWSNHIDVAYNSLFLNNQDPYEDNSSAGEIEADRAGDVNIYNNVAYSDGAVGKVYGRKYHTGNHTGISVLYVADKMGSVHVDHNLTYTMTGDSRYGVFERWNQSAPAIMSHNVFADPRYVNATKDAGAADFRPARSSPALGAGTSSYAPRQDVDGQSRPAGQLDLGAYQRTR